jgi:hypothetical protein
VLSYDRWIPCEKGDVFYAPPGIYNGTRNPKENTEVIVTLALHQRYSRICITELVTM